MNPEIPTTNKIETTFSPPVQEGENYIEQPPAQRREQPNNDNARLVETRAQIDQIQDGTQTNTISPIIMTRENHMEISIDTDKVKSFLVAQGLTEEQASGLKIEYTRLKWSNKITRAIAKYLPGRLGEFFTRIESNKGDTLKIFTNNLAVQYRSEDSERIARDTIHHLMHFVQRKQGASWIKHLITRLPIIHGLSQYEKDARKIADNTDLSGGLWSEIIKFSNTI